MNITKYLFNVKFVNRVCSNAYVIYKEMCTDEKYTFDDVSLRKELFFILLMYEFTYRYFSYSDCESKIPAMNEIAKLYYNKCRHDKYVDDSIKESNEYRLFKYVHNIVLCFFSINLKDYIKEGFSTSTIEKRYNEYIMSRNNNDPQYIKLLNATELMFSRKIIKDIFK